MDAHPISIVNESIVTGQMRGSSAEIFFPPLNTLHTEITNGITIISNTMRDTKHEKTAFTV